MADVACITCFVAIPPADGAKVMKIGELPNTIPDYLFTKFPLAVVLYQ